MFSLRLHRVAFLLLFMAFVFVACHEEPVLPNESLEMSMFAELQDSTYALDSHLIREEIGTLVKNDNDLLASDAKARSYYKNGGRFLWIERHGVDARADSLLAFLNEVGKLGFKRDNFYVEQLQSDLRRVRELDFASSGRHQINNVMARLEYNLTKAYLRYTTGQRFGFLNPQKMLNQYDVQYKDSVKVVYHRIFDVAMDHPDDRYYASALQKIYNDSVAQFLHEVQPKERLYYTFQNMLNNDTLPASKRMKVACNMERCRWRTKDAPSKHKKYVFVNVPAFHLDAVDGDSVMNMRVVCGTVSTKTPLLHSEIKRMELNPQWIIPRSIIEKDIARHAGDKSYFDRRRYFIRERKTGKKVDPYHVSRSGLLSGKYLVAQEGGKGNSLGRIIFRFDNNFSVYLHDTSSPGVFSRDNRGASHGCVRVQRPFDLAVFLLADKDEDVIDKIQYSMTMDAKNADGSPASVDKSRVIHSLPVEPHVPVFISYYTMYPDKDGRMCEYPDVYGYDRHMATVLNKLCE